MFDGGSGLDTVVLLGAMATYTVHMAAAKTVAVTGKGSDLFSNVERFVFDDSKLAFDLDGSAGHTVKLLGALFGAQGVSNQAFVVGCPATGAPR